MRIIFTVGDSVVVPGARIVAGHTVYENESVVEAVQVIYAVRPGHLRGASRRQIAERVSTSCSTLLAFPRRANRAIFSISDMFQN